MGTKKLGRPPKITKEIEEQILDRLALGESARSISRDEDMPSWTTLCKHRRTNEAFAYQYSLSKQEGIETKIDEVNELIRDESKDYQIDSKGETKSDNTCIMRHRLIADMVKWEASKLFPKQYGEKVAQEITGPEGAPLQLPALKIIIEK